MADFKDIYPTEKTVKAIKDSDNREGLTYFKKVFVVNSVKLPAQKQSRKFIRKAY